MASSLALNLLRRLPRITKSTVSCKVCRHCSSLHSHNSTAEKKWLLASAVCIERHPIITKGKPEFVDRYLNFIKTKEVERSSLSDIEIQEIQEKKKSRETIIEEDSKSRKDKEEMKMKVVDLEYMWEEELKKFPFADRITEADINNDMRSIKRALDRKLILIVKHTLGGDDFWMLPQAIRTEEETMRETAERTVKLRCGSNLQSQFFGHAPSGYIIQKYPKKIQLSRGVTGVKVFIYKASYLGGQVKLEEDITDYMWVTVDELQQYLTQKYSHRLSRLVV